MIIENLTINDYRVFQGKHSFDLSPRIKWNKRQPVILFGGLNGAGKTSILSAVRLALYGRQALGPGTSQKVYETYLINSIHRSRDTLLQSKFASIELTFSYSNMGIQSHYRIIRTWTHTKKKIREKLDLYKDDTKIDNLSYEQCQGFLNELIPIGVSELFFFDGEKIAELAEDSTGSVLSDAIKKLLGLDLIETLNTDLTVLLRRHGNTQLSNKDKKEIEKLEQELEETENLASEERDEYNAKYTAWTEAKQKLDRLSNLLTQKGGAWATSQESEMERTAELRGKKENIEDHIRELLSDSYPFSLATTMVDNILDQLVLEANYKRYIASIDMLNKYNKKIKTQLKKILDKSLNDKVNKIIQQEFAKTKSDSPDTTVIHDVSESMQEKIRNILHDAIDKKNNEVKDLAKQLSIINEELDNLENNIARAPNEDSLKNELKELQLCQEDVNQLHAKMVRHQEDAKRYLRMAMDITRKLSRLQQKYIENQDKTHAYSYIDASKSLLKDFSKSVTKRKIHDLENEFINTFKRLARKDDINVRAKIDTNTFKVSLIDDSNAIVNKDELSAGEKQIYAISILDALARTSGRQLPIIIDTPLGRLDSKHRRNLVDNYFPTASHQVIILSTDTEVDETFYRDLYKNMSHAYKLNYDNVSGSSYAEEGYFWRHTSEAA